MKKVPQAIIIHNKVRIFHFEIIFDVNPLWRFSAPSIISSANRNIYSWGQKQVPLGAIGIRIKQQETYVLSSCDLTTGKKVNVLSFICIKSLFNSQLTTNIQKSSLVTFRNKSYEVSCSPDPTNLNFTIFSEKLEQILQILFVYLLCFCRWDLID